MSRSVGSASTFGLGEGEGLAAILGEAAGVAVTLAVGLALPPPHATPNKTRRATTPVAAVALPLNTLYLREDYARG